MLKIIIAVFIFVLLEIFVIEKSAHAAVSMSQVQKVFRQLEGISNLKTKLILINNPQINAFTYPNHIKIYQGMINFLNTDDEIAMVLGHELTHFKYKDGANANYYIKNLKQLELRADKGGYFYCQKLGYKNCLSFPRRMRDLYPNNGLSNPYPTWNQRLHNLGAM